METVVASISNFLLHDVPLLIYQAAKEAPLATEPDSNQSVVANATNGTSTNEKPKSTPEGMAVAYTSLIVMAVIPIFFGSFRSVKSHKAQRVRNFSYQILYSINNSDNEGTFAGIRRAA